MFFNPFQVPMLFPCIYSSPLAPTLHQNLKSQINLLPLNKFAEINTTHSFHSKKCLPWKSSMTCLFINWLWLLFNCISIHVMTINWTVGISAKYVKNQKVGFIWFKESPLKMTNNAFYFMLKTLSVHRIFRFLPRHFWSCRKMDF